MSIQSDLELMRIELDLVPDKSMKYSLYLSRFAKNPDISKVAKALINKDLTQHWKITDER